MTNRTRYCIVQVDQDERPTLAQGRLGVLHPVNMDGFYCDQKEADEVAEYMADERPDLITFVMEGLREIKPRL